MSLQSAPTRCLKTGLPLTLVRDVVIFGKSVPQPRLISYCVTDPSALGRYAYSGLKLQPVLMSDIPGVGEAMERASAIRMLGRM